MLIHMTKTQAIGVARLLNAKFAGRVEAEGHSFSVTKFAAELKIKRGTLIRLMDERNLVEGMDMDVFLALYDVYEQELINAVRADRKRAREG